MTEQQTDTAKPATPKSRRLEIAARDGITEDGLVANLIAEGDATNASTALRFVESEHGDISLTHMVAALREHGAAVNRGDLSAAERMLNSQAVALNAMFAELARRGAAFMGTRLPVAESYLRLALKAQSQSRATVETLAAIKNPPTVFARQANINNGGQQQVNNSPAPVSARASARPGQTVFEPNELLEDSTHGSPQVDTRATAAAGRKNPRLEPVGAVNRAAKP